MFGLFEAYVDSLGIGLFCCAFEMQLPLCMAPDSLISFDSSTLVQYNHSCLSKSNCTSAELQARISVESRDYAPTIVSAIS